MFSRRKLSIIEVGDLCAESALYTRQINIQYSKNIMMCYAAIFHYEALYTQQHARRAWSGISLSSFVEHTSSSRTGNQQFDRFFTDHHKFTMSKHECALCQPARVDAHLKISKRKLSQRRIYFLFLLIIFSKLGIGSMILLDKYAELMHAAMAAVNML